MDKIKKENPDATWGNLLSGLGILVLIAVFSLWYFSRGATPTTSESTPIETVLDENGDEIEVEVLENGEVAGEADEVIEVEFTGEMTTVQEGEGLYNVAERVCGDAEKYNVLADANGLNIWSHIPAGMELKVICEKAEE